PPRSCRPGCWNAMTSATSRPLLRHLLDQLHGLPHREGLAPDGIPAPPELRDQFAVLDHNPTGGSFEERQLTTLQSRNHERTIQVMIGSGGDGDHLDPVV